MFHGHGMVLKWRLQVRLGRVPRIARFRKKTEVSEFQFFYDPCHLVKPEGSMRSLIVGIKKNAGQKQEKEAQAG